MNNATVIGIVFAVVVLLVLVFGVARAYKIPSPNQAFIITGRRKSSGNDGQEVPSQRVVRGFGVFVIPFIHKKEELDLQSKKIEIDVPSAVSENNIRLRLRAVAIVKVGSTDEDIRNAAQRFLGQEHEIQQFTTETLSGSLRAIVGSLTVNDIIRDRAALASKVQVEAETSLTNQGLILDAFQIQDISDDSDYIKNLGRPEAAAVERNAVIAEAEAAQRSEAAQYASKTAIAEADKEYRLRVAEMKAETDAAEAEAAAAGPIAAAERQQLVLEQEGLAAQRAAEVRQRQLEAEVIKPADAEAYRLRTLAQANKDADVLKAEAEAQKTTLDGEAEAAAEKAKGTAKAEVVKAIGSAEADALEKRKAALTNMPEAGVAEIVLDRLPNSIREAAAPMSNVKDLTIISPEGESKLTRNTLDIMHETAKSAGVDLPGLISGLSKMIPGATSES